MRNFKMENVKIGVNENGFHLRDINSGLIFSLPKAYCGRMATGVEECYFPENQDLFVYEGYSEIGICIKHIKTNKLIYLMDFIDGVPVIGFDEASHYDYEEAVKDFFELCSDAIQKIQAGTYHGKTLIQRKDDVKHIRQELLRCLVEGVRAASLAKAEMEPVYEVSANRIVVKMDESSKIKIKLMGNNWFVDVREEEFPVRGLVYTIEAVKKFEQLNSVYYEYSFEGKQYEVCITPQNVSKVLKEAVKRKRIDLTV